MPTVDYYKLFDLRTDASEDVIRTQLDAERRQLEILKRIPAKSADAKSKLELLDKAAEVLLNPEARRLYDQSLAGAGGQDSTVSPNAPIPDVPASDAPAPAVSFPAISVPAVSAPVITTPIFAAPAAPASPVSAASAVGKDPAPPTETKQPVTELTSSKIQISASLLAEMWTCPHCQAQNLAGTSFCHRCGHSKEVQPAVRRRRKWLWFAALILVIVAIAGITWFWPSGTLLRDFDAAVQEQQLFAPQGTSAYDIYKKALASRGADDSIVQGMNSQMAGTLHKMSDENFRRWHDSFDLTAEEWADLAKAEDWLVSMNPSDSTSQARKEYADAQLLFSQGRFSGALKGFGKAQKRLPNWDLAILSIGDSCLALKHYICAKTYYQKALQLEPAWDLPQRHLAELREKQGR